MVLFGNFVILNLFLAILMSNFDEQRSKLNEALESKRELSRAPTSAKMLSSKSYHTCVTCVFFSFEDDFGFTFFDSSY